MIAHLIVMNYELDISYCLHFINEEIEIQVTTIERQSQGVNASGSDPRTHTLLSSVQLLYRMRPCNVAQRHKKYQQQLVQGLRTWV